MLEQLRHPLKGNGAYKIIRFLGNGSFGKVNLARRHSDGKEFAIKDY